MQAIVDRPVGVRLCRLSELGEAEARAVTVAVADRKFHGFVVRRGDRVFGYADRCPHAGLPLAAKGGRFLSRDGRFISCNWHGALFELESGDCVSGPCLGHRLSPWPVAVAGDWIITL